MTFTFANIVTNKKVASSTSECKLMPVHSKSVCQFVLFYPPNGNQVNAIKLHTREPIN